MGGWGGGLLFFKIYVKRIIVFFCDAGGIQDFVQLLIDFASPPVQLLIDFAIMNGPLAVYVLVSILGMFCYLKTLLTRAFMSDYTDSLSKKVPGCTFVNVKKNLGKTCQSVRDLGPVV